LAAQLANGAAEPVARSTPRSAASLPNVAWTTHGHDARHGTGAAAVAANTPARVAPPLGNCLRVARKQPCEKVDRRGLPDVGDAVRVCRTTVRRAHSGSAPAGSREPLVRAMSARARLRHVTQSGLRGASAGNRKECKLERTERALRRDAGTGSRSNIGLVSAPNHTGKSLTTGTLLLPSTYVLWNTRLMWRRLGEDPEVSSEA
jgi:hypothetical protein